MYNIIYFSKFGLDLYYESLRKAFFQDPEVNLLCYGPSCPAYNPQHTIDDVVKMSGFPKVDLLFFSAGWDSDESLETVDPHPNIRPAETDIKKFYLLNKEYKKLDLRLEYAQKNNFDVCFTVHHLYKEWEKKTGLRFEQLPFAADHNIFKDYNQDKKYDFGFTGSLHNYKNNDSKMGKFKEDMMGDKFNNIRERFLRHLASSNISENINIFHSYKFYYGAEYSKLINSSKIWFCTPSAIEIVGTRFFEIMASKSLLLCPESDVYEGIFDTAKHCVTFNPDLSDVKEKILHFSKNKEKREEIIESAYEHFLKNHTWSHRISKIKSLIK